MNCCRVDGCSEALGRPQTPSPCLPKRLRQRNRKCRAVRVAAGHLQVPRGNRQLATLPLVDAVNVVARAVALNPSMSVGCSANKITFIERSYAHCSMCIYMHPRTFDPCLGDESRSLPVGRTLYFQFRYTDPSSHLRQYPFGHQSMASVAMTNRVLCMHKFLWCEERGVPKERLRFEVYDLGYDICPLPRTETVDRFPAWLRGVASPPRGQGAV